jgi:hypothetical protein
VIVEPRAVADREVSADPPVSTTERVVTLDDLNQVTTTVNAYAQQRRDGRLIDAGLLILLV